MPVLSDSPAANIAQAWKHYITPKPAERSSVSLLSFLLIADGLVSDIRRVIAENWERISKDEQKNPDADYQSEKKLFPSVWARDHDFSTLEQLFWQDSSYGAHKQLSIPTEEKLIRQVEASGLPAQRGSFAAAVVANATSVITMLNEVRRSNVSVEPENEEQRLAKQRANVVGKAIHTERDKSDFYRRIDQINTGGFDYLFQKELFPKLSKISEKTEEQTQQQKIDLAICHEYGHAILRDFQLKEKRIQILISLIKQLKKYGIEFDDHTVRSDLLDATATRSIQDIIQAMNDGDPPAHSIGEEQLDFFERLNNIQRSMGRLSNNLQDCKFDEVPAQVKSVNQLIDELLEKNTSQLKKEDWLGKAQVFWLHLKWALNRVLKWVINFFSKEKSDLYYRSRLQSNVESIRALNGTFMSFIASEACPPKHSENREMVRRSSSQSLESNVEDDGLLSPLLGRRFEEIESLKKLQGAGMIFGRKGGHRRLPAQSDWDATITRLIKENLISATPKDVLIEPPKPDESTQSPSMQK